MRQILLHIQEWQPHACVAIHVQSLLTQLAFYSPACFLHTDLLEASLFFPNGSYLRCGDWPVVSCALSFLLMLDFS